MTGDSAVKLSTSVFLNLQTLIYEQSGIFFPANKKYVLEERLKARLRQRNCNSFEEYYHLLKYDAWRDTELNELFNLVTTNETFFYRDLAQLRAFTDVVIPSVMKANQELRQLRVWSAACSTGDEPYTLAILLLEHQAMMNWSIEIVGTDISEASLEAARIGVYDQYAIRNVPSEILKKYFRKEEGRYTLSDQVKQLVTLTQVNLYDSTRMKLLRGFDVIFCRNCLMYFDEKAKRQVIAALCKALRPGGYLVVGAAESLNEFSRWFRVVESHRAVVYQKAE